MMLLIVAARFPSEGLFSGTTNSRNSWQRKTHSFTRTCVCVCFWKVHRVRKTVKNRHGHGSAVKTYRVWARAAVTGAELGNAVFCVRLMEDVK